MSDWTVTKTQMQAGVWEGVIFGSEDKPSVSVTHMDRELDIAELSPAAESGSWLLRIPVPPDAVSDGVQTLVVTNSSNDQVVERITLIAGDALGDDLRAEVDLLRAELDMLKRAFRRHCTETA